jgi:hypothetical protein
VLEGRFTAKDEKRYSLVPFEVGSGHRQIHIRYEYNDRIDSDPTLFGGNTLDIGIFDPRGTATGSEGFRGWSGSNKLELVIGEDWATPPYSAGPILAGTWHVLLGPYKVGPRGCDWRVEVRLDPGLSSPPDDLVRTGTAQRPMLPAAREGWWRGDLHCHTRYSDGDSWPSEMLHAATETGLEFLGVTDHNNVAHHAAYGSGGGPGPLVLPGVEVTTYGGHWNAWGTDRWWEFRTPEGPSVERAMAQAMEAGAFVSVNHPKAFGPPWEYPDVRSFHAVEVWNGPWERANAQALAFWDARLRSGMRLVAVGGSDTHILRGADPDPRHSPRLGAPTTWIAAGARPDAAALVGALRQGRTFVSASPAGPQLYLDPAGDGVIASVRGDGAATLVLIGDAGPIATAAIPSGIPPGDEWSHRAAVPRGSAYVRAEVHASSGDMLALTSPLWSGALRPGGD